MFKYEQGNIRYIYYFKYRIFENNLILILFSFPININIKEGKIIIYCLKDNLINLDINKEYVYFPSKAINIEIIENCLQEDNSSKNNKLYKFIINTKEVKTNNRDIYNPINFEKIEDIKHNNFTSSFCIENENKFDDNSMSIYQNQNIDIIENYLQEDNFRKEKETEENNTLINNRDIYNSINFEEIKNINHNFPSLCKENENENKFDDNSISMLQNNKIEIPEIFQSQESYQFDFFRNPFSYEENNSLTLDSQEYKRIYLLPQDKNSLNLKVKRENSSKIKFINYQIKTRPKHDKFSFDNMMKRVKSLSNDIIIDELNIKINDVIKLKEIGQIKFLKIKPDEEIPTKQYYLDLLHRTFRKIIGSHVNNKYKNKDGNNKELM